MKVSIFRAIIREAHERVELSNVGNGVCEALGNAVDKLDHTDNFFTMRGCFSYMLSPRDLTNSKQVEGIDGLTMFWLGRNTKENKERRHFFLDMFEAIMLESKGYKDLKRTSYSWGPYGNTTI